MRGVTHDLDLLDNVCVIHLLGGTFLHSWIIYSFLDHQLDALTESFALLGAVPTLQEVTLPMLGSALATEVLHRPCYV